jgi:glycosyltransferase involved in cell wall biosynthesis
LRVHENVHIHPAEVSRGQQARFVARRGEELVREHGHALIVSHDYGRFANGIGSARVSRATGVPYVSELHHVPGHPVAADLRERAEYALARLYVRWARSRARAFRVVNEVEMPELLTRWGVPREQIVVLPSLYLDLAVFEPAPAELRYDVVFVGRMVVNKGIERIVDALALLATRGKPLRALFVGKGPRLAAVRARAQQRGIAERCEFVEWVDSPARLAELYRASRLCVCASTCEGGPRFTVEALACGTPVVSTRVGVMSELLASGELGALCGFDVTSLADAIAAQLADEPARRARGARAVQAVQRFEYARAIRNYAAGLYALAGEPLPAPAPERER